MLALRKLFQYLTSKAERAYSETEQYRAYYEEFERELLRGEKAKKFWAWFRQAETSNALVALCTITIAYSTWYQWRATQEQLTELKAQNAQIVKQNRLLTTQTGEMVKQGTALATQNTLVQQQLGETAKQSQAMVEANKIVREQIKRESEQSRAIIISLAPTAPDIAPDKPLRIDFQIRNAGNQQGTITFLAGTSFIIRPDESPLSKLNSIVAKIGNGNRRNVLQPSAEINIHDPPKPPLGFLYYTVIMHTPYRLYVPVIMQYKDGIGGTRTVCFGFYYNKETKTFFADSEYGYMEWDEKGNLMK